MENEEWLRIKGLENLKELLEQAEMGLNQGTFSDLRVGGNDGLCLA